MTLSTYVLAVDSEDRDATRYPDPGLYDLTLSQRYSNVERVELLEVRVPPVPNATHVFLCIESLNHIDTVDGPKFAFAKVPVNPAANTLSSALVTALPPNDLQNPLGKLQKLNVSWKYRGGDPVSFGANAHSFTLRLTCRDRVPAHGGTCVTATGRVSC